MNLFETLTRVIDSAECQVSDLMQGLKSGIALVLNYHVTFYSFLGKNLVNILRC